MIILFMGSTADSTHQGSGEITAAGTMAAEGDDGVVMPWLAAYYADEQDE
jgi:hypothetical protein